ncbi:ABC transporter substrate-binding protein [Mangrovibrevibacter kandeliae]|uniref:ABC transporter substrate-binding protein n=1 Tax=Mangrovibrevibacter kandeliae TaxID=2968473 RepID=UPI002118B098|nr:ABC transporter substrate-binding protein [Aurantimonas sp. CSK15Z-1]MCQ8782880.1 ABC transporter substrate-binding protein [Aurantimonas sp. CSK15Z-1]
MRERMKAFLLAGCLAVSSLALSASAEARTLRVAMGTDAVSFDPIATSDNGSIWTQLLIYDTLIRPDKAGTGLEPGLAKSWTVSPDGLTLTFQLREAKFSDGTPVTPQDVEYSLRRAASEKSDWGRFFRPITGFKIQGDHEIVMTLDKPFTPAFNNLALFSAAILPKAKLEAEGDAFFEHPVGSGPFVLKQWSRGSKIVLAANPNYWQAGKPGIEGAELDIVAEGAARVLKLEAGESDLILDPPLNQMKALEAKDGISVGQVVPYRSDFVMLNTTKPPFDQEKVRQALNYAVDKEGLIKGVLYGAGKVAATAMPVMAYADPGLEPYPYDPAKAKALLAEAGLGNGFSTTMLVNSSNAAHRNVAVALQAMLGAVGVKIDIQMIEGGTMWETTKAGNYETALSFATSDTIDPDQLIGFLAVNPERANAYHTQWKNEQLNALYAEERSTVDGDKRGQQFQEMIRLFKEGAPDIFLYHPASAWAVHDDVKGFEILPTSNFRLEDVTFAD